MEKNTALEKAKASQNILLANEGLLVDDIKLQVNKDYQNQLLANKNRSVPESRAAGTGELSHH